MNKMLEDLAEVVRQAYRAGFIAACKWPAPVTQDVDSSAYNKEFNTWSFSVRTHHAEIAEAVKSKTCAWREDDWDGSWDTFCGNKHQFTDGSPKDNDHAFCPYCGGKLEVVDAAIDAHNSAREDGE